MAEVVVVGGSVAGLATAMALSQAGIPVALVEPDQVSADPATVAIDARSGVPQHANAHNFLALSRVILRDRAPEALRSVIDAGAVTNRFERVFGEGGSGDDDLAAIACRRPVFEAALRRHVLTLPNVDSVAGRVTDVVMAGGRATGVHLEGGGVVTAAFVVDATGRRTSSSQWVERCGQAPLAIDARPSPIAGLALTFKLHEGVSMPEGRWVLGPSGTSGHVSAIVFLGDDRTFTTLLIVPRGDEEVAPLRRRDSYLRGAAALPVLAPWLERADPINEVQYMGGIRNVRHHWMRDDEPALLGVQPIGDALVHTNPGHGWGVSLAFEQAYAFADAYAASPGDLREVARSFDAAVGRKAARRFEIACAFDEELERLRRGESVDATEPASPLWFSQVVNVLAPHVPEVAVRAIRHGHLLEPFDDLRADGDFVELVRKLSAEFPRSAPQGPSREQFVSLIQPA